MIVLALLIGAVIGFSVGFFVGGKHKAKLLADVEAASVVMADKIKDAGRKIGG